MDIIAKFNKNMLSCCVSIQNERIWQKKRIISLNELLSVKVDNFLG